MDIFKVVIDGLLGIAFFIDNVVYSFIPILYRLLLYLANIDLVTGNIPVQALIQRIYILVGVFMLFKLSFSVMSYIVDPDAFSDKSKGFSNLVKRVLIAIVLLVGIPWFFREAYEIQGRILTSGILPRLVLGETMADNYSSLEDNMETSATDVQFMLFGPFFSLNYKSESGDLLDCAPSQDNPTSNVLGTNGMASNEACMNTVAELMDDNSDVSASGVTLRDFFRYEDNGIQDNRKFDSFGGLISWTLSNGNRAIKYYPIASTLCGGYLVFLLLSFCIDVAARIIRMFFLQILSPIAVISSVDPTTNGDSLKEWAKECVKVWASLFLRLLVIFLIIQLVRIVSNTIYSKSIFENNGGDVNMWIYVFLIIGIFQAAKSIPELIEKATGIKMSGDLQLNPFKNAWVAGATGLGLAGASMVGANAYAFGKKTIGGVKNLYNDYMETGENAFTKSVDAFKNWRQSAFQYKAAKRYAKSHPAIGGGTNFAQRRAMEMQNRMREARSAFFNNDAIFETKQAASSFAGIFTGAASGAARGAIGAYGKGLSGAISAANAARRQATDAREDRDVRADIGLNLRDRLRDSIDRWAGVRSDKNYGVGRLDDEIKGLRNEFNRIQSQMRAAAENLDAAQRGVSGVLSNNSVSNDIKNSINGLISATSTEARDSISKQLNGLLSTSAISDTDRAAITNLIDSVSHADALLGQSIDIQKAISKRENASNVGPGHGGGSGKP